ncbi:MAG TPA: SEC-C metal-binding domain-containing protein, partial [Bryobacteraceae bacterium]|nr:SEC-C metal-binding domain-containing protein [Bryobacteraceae bacterium]
RTEPVSATAIHHFSSPAAVLMDDRAAVPDPASAVAVHPEAAAPDPGGRAAVHHFSSPSEAPSTRHPPHATSASQASPTELQAHVAAALAQGMSVSAAARAAGVHRTTIHHWQRTSKRFCAAVEQARREFTESLADDMLDLAHSAIRTLQDLLENPGTPPQVRLKAALAILERPQFPKRGWNFPVRLETPLQQETLDGIADLQADYRMVRMTEAIRRQDETGATVPRPSGRGGVQPCEPPRSSDEPRAADTTASIPRNALCPCGSGQKYKRCCGKDAPAVINAPRRSAA